MNSGAGHLMGAGRRHTGKENKKMAKFIQKAVKKMEKKGTVGAFGKATEKKIAAGKAAGGLQAKRANFAANMKKIANKNK